MNIYAKVFIVIIILAALAIGAARIQESKTMNGGLANGDGSYMGTDGDTGVGSDVNGSGATGSSTGSGNNYVNTAKGFSINIPAGYAADDTYVHQANPNMAISGVKFTIPASTASGTNLSTDSYLSVETVPLPVGSSSNGSSCVPSLFADGGNTSTATIVRENGTTYSMSTSSDAGAGNRYEETIYAIQNLSSAAGGMKSPTACTAIRYFVHYGAIQNYPAGAVKEFNKQALIAEFDAIRRTYATK